MVPVTPWREQTAVSSLGMCGTGREEGQQKALEESSLQGAALGQQGELKKEG